MVREMAHEDIEELQSVKIELLGFVIVHVCEEEGTGLINDQEERIEGLIVISKGRTVGNSLEILHSFLFHQKSQVLRTQFVMALTLDASCMTGSLQ